LLFGGKSLLLFGENGTGKSSFVEALERLLTGLVSTLDGRGQGLSSDRHGPHIRSGDGKPDIMITFDDANTTSVNLHSDVATLPPQIQEYLSYARENLYILRRSQVLNFIEAKPKDRYDMLHPFLPIGHVEAVEGALRNVRDNAEADLQRAQGVQEPLLVEVTRSLPIQLPSLPAEADLVPAVNHELTAVGRPPLDSLEGLGEALIGLSGALEPFGDLSRQIAVSGAIQELKDLAETLSRIHSTELAQVIEDLRASEARAGRVFYEEVIEGGVRWIQQEDRHDCPLCEQPIRPEDVVARGQRRLGAFRDILQLRDRARREIESLRDALRSAEEGTDRTEQRLGSSREAAVTIEPIQAVRSALKSLAEVIGDWSRLGPESIRRQVAPFDADSSLVRGLTDLRQALEHGLSLLPSAEAAQNLLLVRERLQRLSDLWPKFATARAAVTAAEDRFKVAQAVYEAAESARKEEVQAIFDELSQEIDRLYQRLHPDESHGGIRLEVREAVQGSATLRVDFYDRPREDPRAYYSDAHLDTLGLSIFLALRAWYRKQTAGFNLLVLDDVLTSVDNAHAVRLSELLLQDFRDYQIFLTTHDRIWFEHLRDIQARCGVSQVFLNKVIHKWTLEEGPDLREPEEERQALERLIKEGAADATAAFAGRLLEHILQEMRYALRLSVQAKRGEQYEIGELWPAFYASIKKDYPTLYQKARRTLDALDVRWPIRNWVGAHWNTWARNISGSTAMEFGDAVRDLFDRLFCDTCRRFVAPSATPLGQLSCRCGNRLYPALGKEAVIPRSGDELVKATQGALRDAKLDTARYFEWKRAEAKRES